MAKFDKEVRILIFNWRDIKNPDGGGAEILTHEMAKRWVEKGHEVIQFSSFSPSCQKEEVVDGVKIFRQGEANIRSLNISVHLAAFWAYYKKFRQNVDVVIDEIHGLPFFTPLYVKEKKVALICEVAKDLWPLLFGPFLGKVGRGMERFYLRAIYKNIPFLTISPSTRDDLIVEGISPGNITVLPMGISYPKNLPRFTKEKTPTLVFVGRIVRNKGIEEAIASVKGVVTHFPTLRLWIVGQVESGYENYLKSKVEELGLGKNITFFGYLSQEEKFERMRRAHLLISPSLREGWGLTVSEAFLVGTPAVVYNSPGLKDVVKNGLTGIICKRNTPEDLAQNVIDLLKKQRRLSKMGKNAMREAKKYSWDETAQEALEVCGNL